MRTSPFRSRVASFVILALASLVAACGVPTGPDSFEPIADENVPNRLGEPPVTSTTTSTTTPATTLPPDEPVDTEPEPPAEQVTLYFRSRDQLRGIDLTALSPVTREDLRQLLVDGPPVGPSTSNLDNLIVEGLIVDVFTQGGIVTIDLDQELFDNIDRVVEQRAAIGQIVLTFLGNLPFVGQAQFTFDGEPLRVPTADSGFTAEPVSGDDYASLVIDTGLTPAEDVPSTDDTSDSDPESDDTSPSDTEPPSTDSDPDDG